MARFGLPALTAMALSVMGFCQAELSQLIPTDTEYPTDITRNIFVKQIHSHNDYWRDIPLYTALSYGVQSVEADVWCLPVDPSHPDVLGETVYIGHSIFSLTEERTFQSLYVDQLVAILNKTNPKTEYQQYADHINGVFDTASTSTLYLFIDFKTDGEATWEHVYNALEPLRENHYLTTYNETSGEWTDGPITVIGTGNTPYDKVAALKARDVFFDGPLATLNESYPATINPIASASLKSLVGEVEGVDGLTDEQYYTLKSYIDDAHDQGILTRIWETPWWPVQKQMSTWRQILKSGSDFLNADDLEYASQFY